MKLQEIRERAEKAKLLVKKIDPKLPHYMVVMINNVQFTPSELEPGMGNYMELTRHPEVFLPDQDLKIMNTYREEMEALEKEIESLEKEIKKITKETDGRIRAQFGPIIADAGKRYLISENKEEVENIFTEWGKVLDRELITATAKTEKMLKKCNDRQQKLFTALKTAFEAAEFHEPDMELRFKDLNIEEIQKLKSHPLVQAVGKTDLSPASIRVVVG